MRFSSWAYYRRCDANKMFSLCHSRAARGGADERGVEACHDDDVPIDDEFSASKAQTTMSLDIKDISFDVGERSSGQGRKGRGKKGKQATRGTSGDGPGIGGLFGADTASPATRSILWPDGGRGHVAAAAGSASGRVSSARPIAAAAHSSHTASSASDAMSHGGKGGNLLGMAIPTTSGAAGKTAVSVSGRVAALARRRGRVRILKPAVALPHVPAEVWREIARVELLHEARKTAKKRAKAAAATMTEGLEWLGTGDAGGADELSVAVLGHVDSGKSTIIGHTLALCGLVGRREMQSNAAGSEAAGKGSFAHAWAMDRGEEERERGITIDVSVTRVIAGAGVQAGAPGFGTSVEAASAAAGLDVPCAGVKAGEASAMLPLGGRALCILDAPGHSSLVSGAVAAAAHADIALLVLPATVGEFETAIAGGGTAREHCIAARALGLSRLVVAVNKMDTVGWSEDRFEEIKAATTALLCDGLQVSPNSVLFLPLCGMAGQNIATTLAEAAAAADPATAASSASAGAASELTEAARWYTVESMLAVGAKLGSTGLVALPGTSSRSGLGSRGLTLLEALRCVRPATPKDLQECVKPLRLSVSDVFANEAVGIGGTVVVGRIASGWVCPRMPVVALPGAMGARTASVRAVRPAGAARPEEVGVAFAGQTVELVLGGVPEDMLLRAGSVLAWPSHPIATAMEVKCRIDVLPAAVVGSRGTSGLAPAASAAASAAGSAAGSWDDAPADSGCGFRVPPLLPIAVGSRLRMHGLTVDADCTVTRLLAVVGKDNTVLKHRPRVLKQGQRALVRIRFESRVPIEAAKHHKRIGKFLLRQGARNAAAGTVLRVYK